MLYPSGITAVAKPKKSNITLSIQGSETDTYVIVKDITLTLFEATSSATIGSGKMAMIFGFEDNYTSIGNATTVCFLQVCHEKSLSQDFPSIYHSILISMKCRSSS